MMSGISVNSLARQQAMTGLPPVLAVLQEQVAYHSKGHLLIIGPEDLGRLAAERLPAMASITLLANGQISSQDDSHLERAFSSGGQARILYTPLASLKGWMGAFELQVKDGEQLFNPARALIGQDSFDLVLDLGQQPVIDRELKPAGYFTAADLPDLEALQDMQGEFEKPRYIQVNASICAHGDRGQVGCTRCLDVCPADALFSHNQTPNHDFVIEVNQALCHGAGSCTTACPTGALSFLSPSPGSHLERLRQLLAIYRQEGGQRPVVLFHAAETGPTLVDLPDFVLPVALEEVAAVGMEIWMALLVAGASAVALQVTNTTPASLAQLLQRETRLAAQLLEALGQPAARIGLIEASQLQSALLALATQAASWPDQPIGDAFPWEGKRATLNTALEHLYEQAENQIEWVALPASAPFGQVVLDETACTLCMSCVSLCPTKALLAGETQPLLSFTEGQCVQCGLCERACPEQAIRLEPRFVTAPGQRLEPRILKQDQAFHCIRCDKPFASQSTLNKLIKKLEKHPYFQGEAAKRLQMCEDCRVRDSYLELARDPEAQLRL